MKLYLCEKPSQAEVLAKHIGSMTFENDVWRGIGEAVVAAQGHLLALATPDDYIGKGKWKIDDLPILPQEWVLKVKNDKHSPKRFNTIGLMLKQAEHVVLATDPDDEGELIGRSILKAHNYPGKVSRLWVSALNTEGLSSAMANLQPLSATDGYFRAADIRQKLDWLFGINLSRAFSVAFGKTAHIGRIKSHLMLQLVDRDLAIDQFKPVAYHTAIAKTTCGEILQYVDRLQEPALFAPEVISNLHGLAGVTGTISSSIEDRIEVAAPRPYSFSALLVDVSSIGICLTKGVAAIQALYEAGAISYPRTSSRVLPTQDNQSFAAHSAIVLTGVLPNDATEPMATIYRLVQQNLKMHSLGAATITRRTVLVEVGGNVFKLQQQWMEQGQEGFVCALDSAHPLHKKFKGISRNTLQTYQQGTTLTVSEIQIYEMATAKPSYYNEASLLKLMSIHDIGTEATRVGAINSLVENGMAEAIMQTDDQGIELHAPVILRSTAWAKFLAKNLPPSVLGKDMAMKVKDAQATVRDDDSDAAHLLLDATKWILRVMPEAGLRNQDEKL